MYEWAGICICGIDCSLALLGFWDINYACKCFLLQDTCYLLFDVEMHWESDVGNSASLARDSLQVPYSSLVFFIHPISSTHLENEQWPISMSMQTGWAALVILSETGLWPARSGGWKGEGKCRVWLIRPGSVSDTIPSFLDRLPVPRHLYFYGKKHRDSYQFVEIIFDNALICL